MGVTFKTIGGDCSETLSDVIKAKVEPFKSRIGIEGSLEQVFSVAPFVDLLLRKLA